MNSKTPPGNGWQATARLAGGLAAGVGLLALVGWAAGAEILTAWWTGQVPMAPSTAALFLAFGGLVATGRSGLATGRASGLVRGLAGVATLLALMLLVLSLAGITSPLEHLGLPVSGSVVGVPAGHMSPLTAVGFVLAGAALLALALGTERLHAQVSFALALVLVLLAVLLVVAYLLSAPLLYGTGVIPPALSTSVAHLFLGVGLLAQATVGVWTPSRPGFGSPPTRTWAWALALSMAVIVVPAYVLFGAYQRRFRIQVEQQLLAIAELKVSQIELWRDELMRDAGAFYPEALGDLAVRSMRGDTGAADDLRAWLTPIATAFEYQRITLHDSTGVARMVVPEPGALTLDAPHPADRVREVMETRRVSLEGFHRDSPQGPIHLTILLPISTNGGGEPVVVGALAIRVNPEVYLYPTLLSWPAPTRTAETLLVRRDGDDVLFLNNLRFRPDAALDLRLPLSQASLPAAMAVLGAEGIVEGVDYHGEPVVAALRAVSGSDWHVVARMDVAEVYAPLRAGLRWALFIVGLLICSAAVGISLVWQRKEKLHFRTLAEAEVRQGTILKSIGDAVISTDADGRVSFMNPVAEELTGWTQAEAEGRPLEEVFKIIHEETRRPVTNPVARVVRDRKVVGLANHTSLIARDGTEHPIADSGAPVLSPDGELTGVVLVFRDQTEDREAKRRLETEVERAQQYLQVAGAMIVVLDMEGYVEVINRRGAEILGWPEEEIVGKNWFEHFIPESERERIRDIQRTVLRGDGAEPPPAENAVLTRSGEERLIAWNNAVLRDSEGNIVRTVSSGEDITERRTAEEALRGNEERYRNLYGSIRDAILVADMDRNIIGCNGAFTDLFGYAEDEIRGRQTVEIYGSEEEFQRVGARLRTNLEDPGFVQRVRYAKKSGEAFVGETNAFPLRNSQGEIQGFIGLIRDVTDRLAAEEALAASERQFRSLYESAPVGIFRTTSKGRLLAANGAMARLLGFDSPQAAVDHYEEEGRRGYVRPERRQELVRLLEEHGQVLQFEFEALRPDESTVWLSMNARVSDMADRSDFEIEGFVVDVTARKRAEEDRTELQAQLIQAQKMESIGRLAGGVAHDFNNMLAVILSQASMMLHDLEAGTTLYEDLRTINDAAEKSTKLVRQLLTFAREQTVQPKVLDLNDTVEAMLKMLRRTIGEQIQLEWRPGGEAWSVLMDPVQIDQALANLLLNARDAIKGAGTVAIQTDTVVIDEEYTRAHPDASPGDFVLLQVTDSGTGMSEEVKARLFEPFFTTKPPGQGTGLGLSTVYGIVRQNEGFINVYSEPGQGTTFRIYLPRVMGDEARETDARPVPEHGGTETILVVEDEPAVLESTLRVLTRLGYTALSADRPSRALELVAEGGQEIDMMLTDVIMPEMTGRELATRILADLPGLPVLFMSGHPADAIATHGKLAPDVHFIQKPFTYLQLAAKVREVLDA